MMNKVEGSVSLSISELDNLRTQISTLTEEKRELQKHTKEVNLRILVEEDCYSSRVVDDYDAYSKLDDRNKFHWNIPKKLEHIKNKRVINESSSYIGLDDIIKEIKIEEESKVIEKLGSLERQIIALKKQEQTLITKHSENINEIIETHKVFNKKQEEEHKKQVDEFIAKIAILEKTEVDLTKDQEIYKLKQEIENLKMKKGFWGFIHS